MKNQKDDSEQARDRLFYVGVDEAGYGPRLGPLCVAYSAFECEKWHAGEPPPDLWGRLSDAVCRERSETRSGRFAVNDSKRLKLPRSTPARSGHHLAHLERGVLAFLASANRVPTTDGALLDLLTGSRLPGLPWYGGTPVSLPLSTTPDHMVLMSGRLGRACESSGVRFVKAGCRAMDEVEFNERIRRYGNKARVSFAVVAGLLRRVWDREAGREDLAEGGPRVVVDRQGGRTRYSQVLAQAVPGAEVRAVEESPELSRYELVEREGAGSGGGSVRRRMSVLFRVEAECEHLPVALASMVAKLTRELLMARFNAYWGARIRELKPTAGYATDAGRWLREAGPSLSGEDLRRLVRQA